MRSSFGTYFVQGLKANLHKAFVGLKRIAWYALLLFVMCLPCIVWVATNDKYWLLYYIVYAIAGRVAYIYESWATAQKESED